MAWSSIIELSCNGAQVFAGRMVRYQRDALRSASKQWTRVAQMLDALSMATLKMRAHGDSLRMGPVVRRNAENWISRVNEAVLVQDLDVMVEYDMDCGVKRRCSGLATGEERKNCLQTGEEVSRDSLGSNWRMSDGGMAGMRWRTGDWR